MITKKAILKTLVTVFLFSFLIPALAVPVFAQDDPIGLNALPTEGLATGGLSNVIEIIKEIINFLLTLVGILALGGIIWGAIVLVLSLGNDQKVEKAKRIILYSIIGLIVAGVSFLAIQVVSDLLGGG